MSSQSAINQSKCNRLSKKKSLPKQKRIKLKWKSDYKQAQKLVKSSTILHNWRIQKPKRLGYIIVNAWSNDGKVFNSERCTWAYQDPNTRFIYIGNDKESWKLGLTNKYYNNKFPFQSEEKIMQLINELDCPIE